MIYYSDTTWQYNYMEVYIKQYTIYYYTLVLSHLSLSLYNPLLYSLLFQPVIPSFFYFIFIFLYTYYIHSLSFSLSHFSFHPRLFLYLLYLEVSFSRLLWIGSRVSFSVFFSFLGFFTFFFSPYSYQKVKLVKRCLIVFFCALPLDLKFSTWYTFMRERERGEGLERERNEEMKLG